ncbi:hypothetical protein HN843_04525, partial [bacterium]|nr:hypothetical protein [bacterium]
MKKLLLVALTLIVSTSAFAGVIYDLNTGVYAQGDLVTASGTITGVRYNGFSMTELPAGPYTGVWVYCGDASGFAIGDEITITDGEYTEYYDLSEIIQLNLALITITGNAPVAPMVMTVAAAAADYEPWESGFVTFTDGFWVVELLGYGEWAARSYQSSIDLINDDYFFDETGLEVEMCYDGVTGIMLFGYGAFKMNPMADGLVVGDCVIANEEVSFGAVKAL